MAGINFKAFDLGGHEIARRVWKDYYAKVCIPRRLYDIVVQLMLRHVQFIMLLHAFNAQGATFKSTQLLHKRQ